MNLSNISRTISNLAGKADKILKIAQWLVSSLKDFPQFEDEPIEQENE